MLSTLTCPPVGLAGRGFQGSTPTYHRKSPQLRRRFHFRYGIAIATFLSPSKRPRENKLDLRAPWKPSPSMNARERLGGLTTARQHARRACVEGVPEGAARLPQGTAWHSVPSIALLRHDRCEPRWSAGHRTAEGHARRRRNHRPNLACADRSDRRIGWIPLGP